MPELYRLTPCRDTKGTCVDFTEWFKAKDRQKEACTLRLTPWNDTEKQKVWTLRLIPWNDRNKECEHWDWSHEMTETKLCTLRLTAWNDRNKKCVHWDWPHEMTETKSVYTETDPMKWQKQEMCTPRQTPWNDRNKKCVHWLLTTWNNRNEKCLYFTDWLYTKWQDKIWLDFTGWPHAMKETEKLDFKDWLSTIVARGKMIKRLNLTAQPQWPRNAQLTSCDLSTQRCKHGA